MIRKKYIREARQKMEEEYQMNSRLDEYLVKVGAVKFRKPKSNLGLKLAIPLVGALTCCVGVLTTYGIMKSKIADGLNKQETDYSTLAYQYFAKNNFDIFNNDPGSSYSLSLNSDLYIYTAKRNEELLFISQIFTMNDSTENIELHYVNGMDETRILSKKGSDTSSIEIINDNNFVLDDTVINVHVYIDDVFKSTLIVNLINNL